MTALPFIDVLGFWLGIFLTFAILSFLYADNPIYKLAEHLYIGISVGFLVVQQYTDNIQTKVVDALGEKHGFWLGMRVIALVLVVCMFVKAISKRWHWVGRFPLAFVVAFYAGLQINAVAQSELGAQIAFSAETIDAKKMDLNSADAGDLLTLPGSSPMIAEKLVAEREHKPFVSVTDAITRPSLSPSERADLDQARGALVGLDAKAAIGKDHRNWFGALSNLLLLLGLLASLVYFYFSIAHTGAIGKVSRVGVWILMIGFGASFGLTVQGRLALAIGRAYEVLGRTFSPADEAQIHAPWISLASIAIIGLSLASWEIRRRKAAASAGAADKT